MTGPVNPARCGSCGSASAWRSGVAEAAPGGWVLRDVEGTPRCPTCEPLSSMERESSHAPASCPDCGDPLHRAALLLPSDQPGSWHVDVLLPHAWCGRCEVRGDTAF